MFCTQVLKTSNCYLSTVLRGQNRLSRGRPGTRNLKVVGPISAYLISTIVASLLYVVWFLFFLMRQPERPGLIFSVGFALFFGLTGGFGFALVLMSLFWVAVVSGYARLRSWGPLYFVGIGALLMFGIGCATSSLSWKPFFIEDQTFFEGVIIAAQRQGIILLLGGATFGFLYWFLRYSDALKKKETGPSVPD
jgi:hypothetical protein